jgi:hypothetical protein
LGSAPEDYAIDLRNTELDPGEAVQLDVGAHEDDFGSYTKNGMGMRPVLVAAVCSAGAAFVLILGELALLGPTHHVGSTANNSAPVTKNPSQLASAESGVHGTLRPGPIPTDGDGQAQPDQQPTAEAPPSGGDRQPTLAGAVQQALSNNAVPIPIGPPGR